jgi:hypothetical protein
MNAAEAQRWTRIAGVLLLVSFIAGGYGESYAPGKISAAHDFVGTVATFRAGFAAYIIEAICDLSLTAIFYVLLRRVSRPLALIALCIGIFATATFAVGEIFFFAAALPAISAKFGAALVGDSARTFSELCMAMYGYVFSIFAAFYGIPDIIHGYLMFRSGYFPRWLGAIVMIGGAGFVVMGFSAVLVPKYDSMLWTAPMFVAGVAMALWFLVKGIDRAGWEAWSENRT